MKQIKGLKGKNQKGFTIIELVVVILLLGILTATALPRFIDLTDEAHDAARDGVLGGLASGVGLFRAQWEGLGQPTTAIAQFNSLIPNTAGYPIGTDGTLDGSDDCVAIFNGVLQGGRPTISPAGVAASGADLVAGDIDGSITGVDFVPHLNTATSVCEFAYVGQFADAADGGVPVIQLDTTDGDVALIGTEL